MGDVTGILHAVEQGDPHAADELLPLVYDELRRLSSSAAAPATISQQRRTEPAKLTKLVRGELNWIVMKCLEKDRTRRYKTANGLARDLQRYLADEPVEACPPSVAYKFRKFARKYRTTLRVAVIFLLLLALGVIGSTWQAINAMRARDAAATAEQKAACNCGPHRKSYAGACTRLT